jgi:hypothetical protein
MASRGRIRTRNRVTVDDEMAVRMPNPSTPPRRRARAAAAAATTSETESPERNASSDDGEAPMDQSVESSRAASPKREKRLRMEHWSMTIRLGAFSGCNVPLATHLAKLRNCAAYYGWSETERVCHLKASLEGTAASLLWELKEGCSEAELVQLLELRFGDHEQVERFWADLRVRRRRKGESIQALHQDICRLLALSYPGETGTPSKIVGRDAFLESLADLELRIRILEKGASSIEEAFAIAARYEYFMAGNEVMGLDDGSRRRVRSVNLPREAGEMIQRWGHGWIEWKRRSQNLRV